MRRKRDRKEKEIFIKFNSTFYFYSMKEKAIPKLIYLRNVTNKLCGKRKTFSCHEQTLSNRLIVQEIINCQVQFTCTKTHENADISRDYLLLGSRNNDPLRNDIMQALNYHTKRC